MCLYMIQRRLVCVPCDSSGLEADDESEIEFSAFMAAIIDVNTGIREANIRRAFQFLDRQGVGALTPDALLEALGSEDEVEDCLALADLNRDGVVSLDEFRALMQGLNSSSARYRALTKEPPAPQAAAAAVSGTSSRARPQAAAAHHASVHSGEAAGVTSVFHSVHAAAAASNNSNSSASGSSSSPSGKSESTKAEGGKKSSFISQIFQRKSTKAT